jgi:tellurite resistance protein
MSKERRRLIRQGRRRADAASTRDADDAFIALLIAAMDASGHVSAEEAARAHNIIWSMRRFRRRSGERVGRMIERVKASIETHGAPAVLKSSARKIPARLRPAAFAVAVDLTLADGRMERSEARFLRGLAADLGLRKSVVDAVLEVIRIKNSA